MQPAAQAGALLQRTSSPDEDKKRGLKRVVGVVGVLEQTAADAQHHRPVPSKKGLESCLIMVVRKPLQQCPVCGVFAPGRTDHLAKIVDYLVHTRPCCGRLSCGTARIPYIGRWRGYAS